MCGTGKEGSSSNLFIMSFEQNNGQESVDEKGSLLRKMANS